MMYYRSWGVSGGPLVLLLHAQGCHSGWWSWTAPLLAERCRVVAPEAVAEQIATFVAELFL